MNERNEWSLPPEPENRQDDVILTILRLSRALRRCPPEERKEPFPPAVDRLLFCLSKNSGVSSRELCELLDLRPSSLSELLSRGETAGLLIRTADENDRRIQHVSLSEKGQETVDRMKSEQAAEYRKRTSCFSEAEARQFCELSRRLTSHLESLAADRPFPDGRLRRHGVPPFRGPGPGFPPPPGFPDFPSPPGAPECPSSPEPLPAPEAAPPEKTEEQENHRIFPEGARFRS